MASVQAVDSLAALQEVATLLTLKNFNQYNIHNLFHKIPVTEETGLRSGEASKSTKIIRTLRTVTSDEAMDLEERIKRDELVSASPEFRRMASRTRSVFKPESTINGAKKGGAVKPALLRGKMAVINL